MNQSETVACPNLGRVLFSANSSFVVGFYLKATVANSLRMDRGVFHLALLIFAKNKVQKREWSISIFGVGGPAKSVK